MTIRGLILGGLAFALVTIPGYAEEETGTAKVPIYKSPQEVFNALVDAEKKRDYKVYATCLAPESLIEEVGDLARLGAGMQRVSTDPEKGAELAKEFKPVIEVMKRHGVPIEVTRKLDFVGTETARMKAVAEVVRVVKDKLAFVAEMRAAKEKIHPAPTRWGIFKPMLRDVAIDGEKATGTVIIGFQKSSVSFVKVGKSWKCIQSESKAKPKGK